MSCTEPCCWRLARSAIWPCWYPAAGQVCWYKHAGVSTLVLQSSLVPVLHPLTHKVTMLSRVAGGASSRLPSSRHIAGRVPVATPSLPRLQRRRCQRYHRRRTTPLCLAAGRTVEHASSEARRGDLFARGRHGHPHLYPICARRTRTMISSCIGKPLTTSRFACLDLLFFF
jgi:hypothetical protein